jgi:hypothetical protein
MQLPVEEMLAAGGVRNNIWLNPVAAGHVDADMAVRIQAPGAKNSRGNVPFTRGPEAQDEAERPPGTPDWSGCGTIEGLKSAAPSSEYS